MIIDLTTTAEAATATGDHFWEILLTLATVFNFAVTVLLSYATQKLTNATLKAANVEMRKIAGSAVREMREMAEDHEPRHAKTDAA